MGWVQRIVCMSSLAASVAAAQGPVQFWPGDFAPRSAPQSPRCGETPDEDLATWTARLAAGDRHAPEALAALGTPGLDALAVWFASTVSIPDRLRAEALEWTIRCGHPVHYAAIASRLDGVWLTWERFERLQRALEERMPVLPAELAFRLVDLPPRIEDLPSVAAVLVGYSDADSGRRVAGILLGLPLGGGEHRASSLPAPPWQVAAFDRLVDRAARGSLRDADDALTPVSRYLRYALGASVAQTAVWCETARRLRRGNLLGVSLNMLYGVTAGGGACADPMIEEALEHPSLHELGEVTDATDERLARDWSEESIAQAERTLARLPRGSRFALKIRTEIRQAEARLVARGPPTSR